MRLLGGADGGAVIGRHHHDHGGARRLGAAAALRADLRAEMGRGHDHRHAAGDMRQHAVHHPLALVVGQHELLGPVGQDAHALRAGIDHEVGAALLALEVELAVAVEHGGRHGKDAAIDRVRRHGTLQTYAACRPHHSAMNRAVAWVIFRIDSRFTRSSKPWMSSDCGP